jgi:molybdopterin/thiamine biosynthesis adenylyltransferase
MKKTITIVGVGALGSHVLLFLRNIDANFRVIDFDRIEQKNILSQFHGKPGLGRNKVQALEQLMNYLWGVKITAISCELNSLNDNVLLSKSDLIIDCLDNAEARHLVQNFARRTNTPCLHGALDASGTFGRVIWDESFIIDEDGAMGAPTCEGGENLPFIAMVASHMARAIQVFLSSDKKIGWNVHGSGSSTRI